MRTRFRGFWSILAANHANAKWRTGPTSAKGDDPNGPRFAGGPSEIELAALFVVWPTMQRARSPLQDGISLDNKALNWRLPLEQAIASGIMCARPSTARNRGSAMSTAVSRLRVDRHDGQRQTALSGYLSSHEWLSQIWCCVLAATPIMAQAGTLEGVAIGAGSGAVVAGPPGAVVGGVVRRRGRRPQHREPSQASPLLDQQPWQSSMRVALSARLHSGAAVHRSGSSEWWDMP